MSEKHLYQFPKGDSENCAECGKSPDDPAHISIPGPASRTTPLAQRWRKKPVVIDAFQLPKLEATADAFLEWAARVGFDNYTSERDGAMAIDTLEGVMTAQPGDWIIKGVKGEFYPCKPDIFAATYEPASSQSERSASPLVAEVGELKGSALSLFDNGAAGPAPNGSAKPSERLRADRNAGPANPPAVYEVPAELLDELFDAYIQLPSTKHNQPLIDRIKALLIKYGRQP